MTRFGKSLMRNWAVLLLLLLLQTAAIHSAAAAGPATLAENGLGWCEVTLGMSYDTVKANLKQAGFVLRTDLGMFKREDYTYSSTFGASKGGLRYQIHGDKWERRVYQIDVEVSGIDSQSILTGLTRIHGEPADRPGEFNYAWNNGRYRVSAFLAKGMARLGFVDVEVDTRIANQAMVDQGYGEGEKTAATPAVDYYNRTQQAFADALPSFPDEWETTDATPMGIVTEPLSKYMDRPMQLSYSHMMVNRAREDELEQRQAAAIERSQPAMEKAREAMEKKVEALRPKMEALGEQARIAAERGNLAEVQRLSSEMEALQSRLAQETDIESLKEIDTEVHTPVGFDSRCLMSVDSFDLYHGQFGADGDHPLVVQPPVDGNIPVFGEDLGADKGSYLCYSLHAFVGPVTCRLAGQTLSVSRPDFKKVPRMGIGCIKVTVSAGTRESARQSLEKIDWKKLRALVTR